MTDTLIISATEMTLVIRDATLASADTAMLTSLDALMDGLESDVESHAEGFDGGTW